MTADSPRFSAQDALGIQQEHLAQWRLVLRPDVYAALETHIAAKTAELFEAAKAETPADRRCALGQLKEGCSPYDVPRGTSLEEFVGNYAIRAHAALKSTKATPKSPHKEFPKKEWRWMDAVEGRAFALCTGEKVYAPNLRSVGFLDLSQAAVLDAPELTHVGRLKLGNCELRAPKLKTHKAEREQVAKANQALLAHAMEGKIETFTLRDPRGFEFERLLKAKGIQYRTTSQAGSDVTFYLEGHPRFQQRAFRQDEDAQAEQEDGEGQRV